MNSFSDNTQTPKKTQHVEPYRSETNICRIVSVRSILPPPLRLIHIRNKQHGKVQDSAEEKKMVQAPRE